MSSDFRNALLILVAMIGLMFLIAIDLPRSFADRAAKEILAEHPFPTFTADFIATAGIAGHGVRREHYPRAHAKILASGCVRIGDYFGSAQMNCVLRHYGYAHRVSPGEDSRQGMTLLNATPAAPPYVRSPAP